MMSPWVGLARSPLSRRRRRTFQASESLVSRVTMASSSPFPCTAVTMSEGSFLSSFSSSKTSQASLAPQLPGLDGQHDLVVTQHRPHGVQATGKGLAQEDEVRPDVFMADRQPSTSPGQSHLGLIQ